MLKNEIETVSFIIYLLNAPLTKIFILYSGFTEGYFRSIEKVMDRESALVCNMKQRQIPDARSIA